MSDTTAPALTDEQIENLRLEVLVTRSPEIRERRLTMLLAAVEARAARRERERIAATIAARLTGDKHGCLRHGIDCPACRALDRAIDYVKAATEGDLA